MPPFGLDVRHVARDNSVSRGGLSLGPQPRRADRQPDAGETLRFPPRSSVVAKRVVDMGTKSGLYGDLL